MKITENKQREERRKFKDSVYVLALISGVSAIACIFGLCALNKHQQTYLNKEIDGLRKQLIETKGKYYDLLEEHLYTEDAFEQRTTWLELLLEFTGLSEEDLFKVGEHEKTMSEVFEATELYKKLTTKKGT